MLSDQLRQFVQAAIDSGTSQSELARKIGIHQPTLSNWLNHKKGITLETADAIAEVVGVRITSIEKLVEVTKEPTGKRPPTARQLAAMGNSS